MISTRHVDGAGDNAAVEAEVIVGNPQPGHFHTLPCLKDASIPIVRSL